MQIDQERLRENAEKIGQHGAEIGKTLFWIAKTLFGDKKKNVMKFCEGLISLGKWGRVYSAFMLKKVSDETTFAAVPALTEAIYDEEPMVVSNAAYALGKIGKGAGFAVYALKICADTSMYDVCREAAAEAISKIGDNVAAGFSEAAHRLKDDNSWVRGYSCELIGSLGAAARNAVPHLKEALQDNDGNVRSCAAKALGSMGAYAAPAAATLLERLTIDEDFQVKNEALNALINIGPYAPGIMETLTDVASGSDSALSDIVLSNISKLGEVAFPILLKTLRDGNLMQKRKAAQGLGELGANAKDAIRDLTGLLMSDDGILRSLAKNSLHKIKTEAKIF